MPKEVYPKDKIDIVWWSHSIMAKVIYIANMIEGLNSKKAIALDIIHIFVFQNSIQVRKLDIVDIV